MEKEFVPYEEALALKELGFDEPCLAYYDGTAYDFKQCKTMVRHINSERLGISAPLYQQAFRWFRVEYGWTIKINQILKDEWSFTLENFILEIDLFGGRFNSYEEAELECLRKLIEIVKEK